MPLANTPLRAVGHFPLDVFHDKIINYCFYSLYLTCTAIRLIAQLYAMAEAILTPYWRLGKPDNTDPSAADKESIAHYMIVIVRKFR